MNATKHFKIILHGCKFGSKTALLDCAALAGRRSRCTGKALVFSAGESGAIVRAAIQTVGFKAMRVNDEPTAAVTIEHHQSGLLRLGQLDAGAAQGFFDAHVIALDQPAAMRVDVGLGPGHSTGLTELTYPGHGVSSLGHHGLGKVACEYAVLTKPNQVVSVPALRLLDVKLGCVGVLLQRFVQADILVIDTDSRPSVDIGLGPRDVSVAVITNAVPGEHLCLCQVGDIS